MTDKKKNLDGKTKKVDPLKKKIEFGKLPSGNVGEIHYMPRLNLIIGVNPRTDGFPIELIETYDGSLSYYFGTSPVATITTSYGELILSTVGVYVPGTLQKTYRAKIISWHDSKRLSMLLSKLTLEDPVFQKSIAFVPGGIITALDPCGLGRESLDQLFDFPRTVKDCTKKIIDAVTDSIDLAAHCMSEANHTLGRCKNNCSGAFGSICRGGCYVKYGIDVAICAGKSIVTFIVEVSRTVWECVVLRGYIEGSPKEGDILLFEADSPVGHAIDIATCRYGYSHAGMMCGSKLIHSNMDGVHEVPLSEMDNRSRAIIRLGLSDSQITTLCECVKSKIGQDYDYLELITFGTINDPGRDSCTMLIMHCLDEMGIDRTSMGLAGFVSPNDIARTYDAPPSHFLPHRY